MPVAIPFIRNTDAHYGVPERISPLIRRVLARNPGPFTFTGTGTYLVGRGEVAVIDPGPAMPEHVDAIHRALEGERVTHILITHTHSDHSGAARALALRTGAKTLGFGPHPKAAEGEEADAEEGADRSFVPDALLKDGDRLTGAGWTLTAVHTPGHCANHLCFALREEKALFTGDHVMGWSTSIVSPPEGVMADYFASLELLLRRDDAICYPTHGAPISDPKPFVEALIAHRRERERQILDALTLGQTTVGGLVEVIYKDVPKDLHPAAARSVLAHLIHMASDGRVRADRTDAGDARYRLA